MDYSEKSLDQHKRGLEVLSETQKRSLEIAEESLSLQKQTLAQYEKIASLLEDFLSRSNRAT